MLALFCLSCSPYLNADLIFCLLKKKSRAQWSSQVVREASKRVLGLRPFDVQLIGGMILHVGQIAEMRTGEGKTLVAVLPAFLNALSGKGVQVTPNCQDRTPALMTAGTSKPTPFSDRCTCRQ